MTWQRTSHKPAPASGPRVCGAPDNSMRLRDMRSTSVPEVYYARSGDVSIAYQLVGDSPRDLVFVPTFSNLVYPWWNEDFRKFYERLGAFARLILLDKRGTGLSDRPRDLGTLETRIDDVRAVLDAAGS